MSITFSMKIYSKEMLKIRGQYGTDGKIVNTVHFFRRKWFSVGYMASGYNEYISYQAEPMTKL